MTAQAGKVLTQVAGYVGVKTIEMGLRLGLIQDLADSPHGLTASDLAKRKGMDPRYTQVWCRNAYASEILDLAGPDTYVLAPHMDTLLLDEDSPGFVGGVPLVMTQPEFMDLFGEVLPTGRRIWWDEVGPDLFKGVSLTARPFNTRLIPGESFEGPGTPEPVQWKHARHGPGVRRGRRSDTGGANLP
jgi:hypothetical protein